MKDRLAKISSIVPVVFGTLLTSVGSIYAQSFDPRAWFPESEGPTDLNTWIPNMLEIAVGFAALAAVVMLIFAGFLYITANGDEAKIGKATKTLTFAIVGLVICFIAVILVEFVLKNILGVN